MKTEDRGLRMEDGGSGEVLGFAGVRTAPFQSARGLAQSKTWRRFGRASYVLDDNTGFWQFLGVLRRDEQREMVTKRFVLLLGLQGLGTGRGREIRINPHLTAFARIFFWGGKKIQNDYFRNPNPERVRGRVTNQGNQCPKSYPECFRDVMTNEGAICKGEGEPVVLCYLLLDAVEREIAPCERVSQLY